MWWLCSSTIIPIFYGSSLSYRIREKRKLAILESRERRRLEGPKLPRTAKKVDLNEMGEKMEELGVELDMEDEEVSPHNPFFCIKSVWIELWGEVEIKMC